MTHHAGGVYGRVVFGHQRMDQLVAAIEGHIVERSPASLGLAVDVGVLSQQHLADISVAGLCRQVEGGPRLLVEDVNPGVHVQEDLDEVEMAVTGGQQERRPARPESGYR